MDDAQTGPSIRRLILVPAIITFGVTLLRLVGELNRWSSAYFNREAGGPGAIVGIVWLAPVFGIYFGAMLCLRGASPAARGRALAYAVGGLVLAAALIMASQRAGPTTVARVLLINVAAALSSLLVLRGWPVLFRTLLAYGLAARVPVAIIMLLAMAGDWGTHYELGPPGLPEMSLVPKWLLIGLLPQLFFWIGYTILSGGLLGSIAALVVPQRGLTAARAARSVGA